VPFVSGWFRWLRNMVLGSTKNQAACWIRTSRPKACRAQSSYVESCCLTALPSSPQARNVSDPAIQSIGFRSADSRVTALYLYTTFLALCIEGRGWTKWGACSTGYTLLGIDARKIWTIATTRRRRRRAKPRIPPFAATARLISSTLPRDARLIASAMTDGRASAPSEAARSAPCHGLREQRSALSRAPRFADESTLLSV